MKKRIISFLLALMMAVSLLPVSAFAEDGAYTVAKDATINRSKNINVPVAQAETSDYIITISALESKGTIQFAGTTYPLYYVQIDGNIYTSLTIKEGEKITVDGKSKSFPSSLFPSDDDDRTKRIFTGASKPHNPELEYFSLATSYYNSYKEKIELSEKLPENSDLLLWRMPYGTGNKKSPWVTYAFLLVS